MVRSERRHFLTAAGALVAASLTAEAQAPVKIARIGYLNPSLANADLFQAFRQGLHDLGYVEGRNVLIEFRTGQGKPELLPGLAAELVALEVDVIVTGGGTLAAQAAQHATSRVPIVVVSVADPVSSGLVASLARPGGNVTGLSLLFPELIGKCLEQLKLAVPSISRVAVLWQPGAVLERTQMDILGAAEAAARTLDVQLQVVEARGARDIDKAFSNMISGAPTP
jgi:putative ABC transport system substrate-binding protein